MLALVRKAFVVESFHDDLDLFFEQFAIGFLVQDRRAEGLDLAAVITAADAEHGAPLGQDIRDGIVLGEAQRMPHRRDIEPAADFQLRCQMAKMHRRHQQVRDDLIPLVLEVVLGHPQRVPAGAVHEPGDRLGLGEHAGQLFVGEAAFIGWRGELTVVGQIDVAGIDGGEFAEHGVAFAV
jgi:hypothetical protein